MNDDIKHNGHILLTVYGTFHITTRAYEMGHTLKQAGYKVSVLSAPREPGTPRPARDQLDGIDIAFVPLLTRLHLLDIIKLLLSLIRGNTGQQTKQMPPGRAPLRTLLNVMFFNLWILRLGGCFQSDVVLCYDVQPLSGSWVLSKCLHIPMIFDAAEGLLNAPTNLRDRLLSWSEHFFAPRATVVITVGERLKTDLQAMGCEHVEIIGNWKRLEVYDSTRYNLSEERKRLNIPDNHLIVSYIGLLFNHREIKPLLKAVQSLPEVTLLIAGRGDLVETVHLAASKYSNIHWLGWVSQQDLPKYAALSDVIYCCLSPNTQTMYYAMPNKLFESFAAGRTILATRGVGEMSDLIEQTGAGYLVEETTPSNLISAFQDLQDTYQRETIEAAARQTAQQYNWSVAKERLIAICEALIATP